jgi:glutathione S-transferase
MKYVLYYWPGIQGRGEFVRLALEEAGAEYVDTALLPEKEGGGVPAMMAILQGDLARPPYAPPVLKAGRHLIGQTANILQFLGPRHALVPGDAGGRAWVNQLQLTIGDFTGEIHDTHHPCGPTLYYEEQKPEAMRRTKEFLGQRLPRYLGYFQRVVERSGGPWLLGRRFTYADLSLAQVVAGLRYAFPVTTKRALGSRQALRRLHDSAFDRPRIRRYVRSGRRLPFCNDDLFRHYPELGR